MLSIAKGYGGQAAGMTHLWASNWIKAGAVSFEPDLYDSSEVRWALMDRTYKGPPTMVSDGLGLFLPPTLGEAAFVYGSGFIIGKAATGYRYLRGMGKSAIEVGLETRLAQKLAYMDRAPYNPHTMHSLLTSKYGTGNVSSSTLPRISQPNVKLANKELMLPMPTGENLRVPFDTRGFPIFEKYSIYETKLPSEIWRVRDRAMHFKAATAELESSIRLGAVSPNIFSEIQLQAIMKGNTLPVIFVAR